MVGYFTCRVDAIKDARIKFRFLCIFQLQLMYNNEGNEFCFKIYYPNFAEHLFSIRVGFQ